MFENAVLSHKIKLFKRYLQTFHKYHSTYLSRLYIKLGIMWGQINQDIRLGSQVPNISSIEVNKQKIESPTISIGQQDEIYKFLNESGGNNKELREELDSIISHISSENDMLDDINSQERTNSECDSQIELLLNEKINIGIGVDNSDIVKPHDKLKKKRKRKNKKMTS